MAEWLWRCALLAALVWIGWRLPHADTWQIEQHLSGIASSLAHLAANIAPR